MNRLGSLSLLVLLAGCGPEVPHRTPLVAQKEAELRPTDTTSSLMWKYVSGDVVESLAIDGGAMRVHYTRTGTHAVPAADANDSGVPDFVEAVAGVYEEVGGAYAGALGFQRPLSDEGFTPNGGDGRFDVYLLDFARSADGAFRVDRCLGLETERCIGYVVQENDFAGYGYSSTTEATRILGSHEYFHAVQAAYDNGQDVVVSEGTAVWATERFDPSTDDFEHFIDGYLDRADRSIDSPPPGPVPTFAYGSAIFFKFLSERFGDAIVRELWEHLQNGQGAPSEPNDQANPTWLVQLDALLRTRYQTTFADAFAEFARWNLYMGFAADATKAWDDASAYPDPVTTDVTAPHRAEGLRVFYASTQYFRAPAGARTRMTAAVLDGPFTATDDRAGLRVFLAARKAGRNVEVVPWTGTETVDVAGGELVVAVVNTARGANGASLSQRPALCLGSPEEVAACAASFQPAVDAGVPDAGSTPPPDAGAPADAGTSADAGAGDAPPPPSGCGCGMTPGWPVFLGALLLVGRRRARR